jgi:hypothetical protein
MTSNSGATVTAEQIIEALHALGANPIIDPEHGPDQVGPEHVPYLLGGLAAIIDTHLIANVYEGDDTRRQWAAGYVGPPTGPADLESMLGQVGVRTQLHTHLIGHAAASGVEYGRLAYPVTAAAATLTLAASQLTRPDRDAPPGLLRTVHKRVKQLLRDTRGAIDALERRLRSEGYEL